MDRTRREFLAAAGAVGLAGCAGADSGEAATTAPAATGKDADSGGATTTTAPPPEWLGAELTDVTTGETFTVAGLAADRPVLLATFAIWCGICTSQQHALAHFRSEHPGRAAVVSLNVDPNERRAAVVEHAEAHGFDWRFVVAPPGVSHSLSSAFGPSMLHPPSAPVAVVCRPDRTAASVVGSDGLIKGTDTLLSAVEGC
ncbi:MAG: peroxiredoxin family protein [Halobacteriaceae archaeon]